ncbi:DMT family transporter [Bacillus marinisedimentorum]|uniref:DMT family transporter n=1 Tax=Bacillus marinisedimentorum TaxID=1821260 RepID=UPI000871F348|nr:multidrug efflux SMR transporter [Bacillus marinisedimentorum]
MNWLFLIIGGMFEVIGVLGINLVNSKRSVSSYSVLLAGFLLSFLFLSKAMETIPMGTAYAVWTGIGTAGSALLGMAAFGESRNWKRLFFISLIICSVIGLKLISP